MKKALLLALAAILIPGLIVGMTGCGEDADEEEIEPAKLIETSPATGGKISANGSLLITFDNTVTEVKVNGISAEVAGAQATWKGQAVQVGSQIFRIEWVDESGNTGSQDVTLTVEAADSTPPKVEKVSVQDGSVDLDPDGLNSNGIVIEFSERIDTGKSKDALALFKKRQRDRLDIRMETW